MIFIIIISMSVITEILFHRLLILNKNDDMKSYQCINEPYGLWKIFAMIFNFIHHLIPFCLNSYSIIKLIYLVSKSKSKIRNENFVFLIYKQMKKFQEQCFGSLLMIISSLPQLIIGFILNCHQWNNIWLRHIIIISYLFSYIPQVTFFTFFIYSSSIYKQTFQKSFLVKWISKRPSQ